MSIETFFSLSGWGDGSDSNNLYQVPLELLPSYMCPDGGNIFRNETMICAGDVKDGLRGGCTVGTPLRRHVFCVTE